MPNFKIFAPKILQIIPICSVSNLVSVNIQWEVWFRCLHICPREIHSFRHWLWLAGPTSVREIIHFPYHSCQCHSPCPREVRGCTICPPSHFCREQQTNRDDDLIMGNVDVPLKPAGLRHADTENKIQRNKCLLFFLLLWSFEPPRWVLLGSTWRRKSNRCFWSKERGSYDVPGEVD